MQNPPPRPPDAQGAPHRTALVLALLHAGLFVASLAIIPLLAPSAKFPNPFGPDDASRQFFVENAFAIRWSDWLQLASASCLGALACVWQQSLTGTARQQRAATLTLAGGLGSAVLLMLAALSSWALASPATATLGPAFHALQFLPFLLGGPGWAACFALFLLGASASGTGLLPRWMLWGGYGLSAGAALATLVLVSLVAAPLLPLSRFLGFVWLVAAALLLRRSVPAATERRK